MEADAPLTRPAQGRMENPVAVEDVHAAVVEADREADLHDPLRQEEPVVHTRVLGEFGQVDQGCIELSPGDVVEVEVLEIEDALGSRHEHAPRRPFGA